MSTSTWNCGNPPSENNCLFFLLFISLLMKAKLDLCNKRSFWFIELHNYFCYCSSSMTCFPWTASVTPRRILHFQNMHLNLLRPWDTTLYLRQFSWDVHLKYLVLGWDSSGIRSSLWNRCEWPGKPLNVTVFPKWFMTAHLRLPLPKLKFPQLPRLGPMNRLSKRDTCS